MNKTILVIEDEKSLSSAIESSLIKSDFSVLMANKVDDAIELLTSNPKVDAVWLDHYLLGNKNGLDFMHELKANKKWNNIPVFVVTNSVSDEKVDTCEVLGIEKYFVKSNNSLNDIIDTIKASIL